MLPRPNPLTTGPLNRRGPTASDASMDDGWAMCGSIYGHYSTGTSTIRVDIIYIYIYNLHAMADSDETETSTPSSPTTVDDGGTTRASVSATGHVLQVSRGFVVLACAVFTMTGGLQCPPGEHPLTFSHCFWFMRRNPGQRTQVVRLWSGRSRHIMCSLFVRCSGRRTTRRR